jgi:hypothetical protein
LVLLWRRAPPAGAPDDAALKAAAADVFRDEALIVVAARPGTRGDKP